MSHLPQGSFRFRFDMRSDIVAPPSDAVCRALADAACRPGEFAWREDPIERALDARTSQLLGKPAAALFPTCTAANIAGLVALGARERTLVMGESCHLATNEMAGLVMLTSRRPHLLHDGSGVLDLAEIPDDTDAILCLENTHNRRGGTIMGAAEVADVARRAKSRGWSVFLDGSRLWNAAIASGDTPAMLAAPVDVVSVSFNKALAAPNGAALAGPVHTIEAAVKHLRSLGGILRPSHMLAAGALAALDEMESLEDDHKLARETALAISRVPGFKPLEPQTNIVMISGRDLGLDGPSLAAALGLAGLGCLAIGPERVRLVFHRGVAPGSAEAIANVFEQVASLHGNGRCA